jgi:hypothetical protein
MDLTLNPNTEKLTKTKVKGRTVYVSKRNESAYVETDQGLVSMTNLSAWNHLIEEAKKKEIDGYDDEKSLEEKQLEKDKKLVADKIQELQRELAKHEGRFR